MTARRIAKVSVAFHVIRDFLFPEANILNARISFDPYGSSIIDFIVEHRDLEPIQDGDVIPEQKATYKIKDGQIKFDGWYGH